MERSKALALFSSLEREKNTDLEGDPPVYDVRLDATMDRQTEERTYRVRVTEPGWPIGRDAWQYVFEQAAELEVDAIIQNSGVELT
jgi:hypothetical protein